MKKVVLFVVFAATTEILSSSAVVSSASKTEAQQVAVAFSKISSGFKRDLGSAD